MTNHITIEGRLATDPNLKFTASGKAVCELSIPDEKSKKDDAGNWQKVSETTWFRVTLWEADAEAAAETLRKGDTVIATGRLITRGYESKDGSRGSSLELDYPTVAKVIKGASKPQTSTQPWAAPADPWAGEPEPSW